MKVNKNIEKPSNIIGLPMLEFVFLAGYFFSLIFVYNILGTFNVHPNYWYLVFVILSTWGIYLLLKWASKNKYPGFLVSYLSFKFLQSKNLDIHKFKITIKK